MKPKIFRASSNKKAEGPLSMEGIVRLLSVVAVMIVLAGACKVIMPSLPNADKAQLASFNNFVKKINNMENPSDEFSLKLKDDAAVIGFSKSSQKYEHTITSQRDLSQTLIKSRFKKPDQDECKETSCICLCRDKLESDNEEITCTKTMQCEKIFPDILDSNLIFIDPYYSVQTFKGMFKHWKGGFLLGKSIDFDFNGLPKSSSEVEVFIEKRTIGDKTIIGICSPYMTSSIITAIENKRQEFFGNKCVITEFEEAKQFESLAKNNEYETKFGIIGHLNSGQMNKNAIKKYEEFLEKYSNGIEVEESLFRLGELYIGIDDNKAKEYLTKLIATSNSMSKFKEESEKRLKNLKNKTLS